MLQRAQTRVLPLLNKTPDLTPAVNVCCGVCRTCTTSNVLTVGMAALGWIALQSRRLLVRGSCWGRKKFRSLPEPQ